ncbi:MAG: hypothetical protein M1503_01445 [Thaumarchaeota archaeon]|nr:hypothetical protein [Nitrososphaerota archaeon]
MKLKRTAKAFHVWSCSLAKNAKPWEWAEAHTLEDVLAKIISGKEALRPCSRCIPQYLHLISQVRVLDGKVSDPSNSVKPFP